MASAHEDIMQKLKKVESEQDGDMVHVVPVTAGPGIEHPMSIRSDEKEPDISEKLRFKNLLLPEGQDVRIDAKISDEDIEILEHKAYVAKTRDFYEWLVNSYLGYDQKNLDDQGLAWLREHCPEYLDLQTKTMEKMNDDRTRYELIMLNGPTSLKDIMFCYVYDRERQNNEYTRIGMVSGEANVTGLMDTEMMKKAYGATGTAAIATTTTPSFVFTKPEQGDTESSGEYLARMDREMRAAREAYERKAAGEGDLDAKVQEAFDRGLFNYRKRSYRWFNEWYLASQLGKEAKTGSKDSVMQNTVGPRRTHPGQELLKRRAEAMWGPDIATVEYAKKATNLKQIMEGRAMDAVKSRDLSKIDAYGKPAWPGKVSGYRGFW